MSPKESITDALPLQVTGVESISHHLVDSTAATVNLNRDPLDDIPHNLLLPAVVGARGARIDVAGQALHVFQRHALFEQIVDSGDPELMRRQANGQAGVLEPTFDHPADV